MGALAAIHAGKIIHESLMPREATMPALVYRGIDDISNLRIMRVVLEALRVKDYGKLRVGPFDDTAAAESGIWIEGPKRALDRLRPDLDRRLAKATLPAIADRLEIGEVGTNGQGTTEAHKNMMA